MLNSLSPLLSLSPLSPSLLFSLSLPLRSVSYSRDESSRARELLSSVAQLQPLVFGLAEELLSVSLELNVTRLQQVLDGLTQQVRREEEEEEHR